MWHAGAVVGVLRKSVSGILPKMDCGGGGGGRHGHGRSADVVMFNVHDV